MPTPFSNRTSALEATPPSLSSVTVKNEAIKLMYVDPAANQTKPPIIVPKKA